MYSQMHAASAAAIDFQEGKMEVKFDRETLFCRMIGILSQRELDALATKTVAVPGCGGVGYTHAESLARMGIGRMRIADFDAFGPENIGRQFGATIHTVGRSKVAVLEERLRSINPALIVETFSEVSPRTVDRFLAEVDLVCDAIDYFSIMPRRLMYREARKRNIPVACSGPLGFGATLHIFEPDGMSFDEYYDLHDGQCEEEMLRNFDTGLNPGQLFRHSLDDQNLDFKNKSGSVVSSSCLLCSALMGFVALSRLTQKSATLKPVPYIYQLDLAAAKFVEIHVPRGVKGIKADPASYVR
jgi:molybdopterin/thiamine biosynthesis adenylyltransferase